MRKTRKPGNPVSAEQIARIADQGKSVAGLCKREGRMLQAIQRVHVDLTAAMLEELDLAAQDLKVSRQSVIETLVKQALDQTYLARRTRKAS